MGINIVTYTDAEYFGRVVGLIGSALKTNGDAIDSIDVWDMGITAININWLNCIRKVNIRHFSSHPDWILKKHKKHSSLDTSEMVTGLYAFKPWVLYHSLHDHDQVLILDAGITVKGSLMPIWDHITENGYWTIPIHDINWMLTKYIKEKLNVTEYEWQQNGFSAGCQGINKKLLDTYVKPVYDMVNDINLFIDDGTASGGINAGRHDQCLFSIQGVRCGMKPSPSRCDKWIVTEDKIEDCNIYLSRGDSHTDKNYQVINKNWLK